MRDSVLAAYGKSISQTYIMTIPFGVLAFAGGLLLKNSKLQTKEQEEAAVGDIRGDGSWTSRRHDVSIVELVRWSFYAEIAV